MDTQMRSSPIDFAAMTHQERLQWLAERKKPTGEPLLPGLRYPCQVGLTVHFGEDDTSHTGETCPGWQASLDAEHLLLGELAKAGFQPDIWFNDEGCWRIEISAPLPYRGIVWTAPEDDTWESALSLAACRAVEAGR